MWGASDRPTGAGGNAPVSVGLGRLFRGGGFGGGFVVGQIGAGLPDRLAFIERVLHFLGRQGLGLDEQRLGLGRLVALTSRRLRRPLIVTP